MPQLLRIKGATRTIGKEQGYLGLSIRDGLTSVVDTGAVRDGQVLDDARDVVVPMMETAWSLLPHEIDALLAGHSLVLRILGNQHPPVMLYVDPEK